MVLDAHHGAIPYCRSALAGGNTHRPLGRRRRRLRRDMKGLPRARRAGKQPGTSWENCQHGSRRARRGGRLTLATRAAGKLGASFRCRPILSGPASALLDADERV